MGRGRKNILGQKRKGTNGMMNISDKDKRVSVELTRMELEALLDMLGYYISNRAAFSYIELAAMAHGITLGNRLKRRLAKSFTSSFSVTLSVQDIATLLCMFAELNEQTGALGEVVRYKFYESIA